MLSFINGNMYRFHLNVTRNIYYDFVILTLKVGNSQNYRIFISVTICIIVSNNSKNNRTSIIQFSTF